MFSRREPCVGCQCTLAEGSKIGASRFAGAGGLLSRAHCATLQPHPLELSSNTQLKYSWPESEVWFLQYWMLTYPHIRMVNLNGCCTVHYAIPRSTVLCMLQGIFIQYVNTEYEDEMLISTTPIPTIFALSFHDPSNPNRRSILPTLASPSSATVQ